MFNTVYAEEVNYVEYRDT